MLTPQIDELQQEGDKFMADLTAICTDPTASGQVLATVAQSLVTVARMVR